MADEEPQETSESGSSESWESQARQTLTISTETLQRTNQALALQARRLDDLAALHESHIKAWEQTLTEAQDLMKSAREATAAADQARGELVSATAALVKIAQVQQQMLQALADEQQS